MKKVDLFFHRSLAILACKYINKSKGNNNLRLQFKRKLFKLALERNYTRAQIGCLIKFIEFMLVLPKDMERDLKHEFLTTHGKMASTTPILPENYDYPLPDFVHRLVHGIGIDERLEKVRKAEEKARKAAEEKARKAEEKVRIFEVNQISSTKKLAKEGFDVDRIAELLNVSIESVREWLA